MSINMVLFRHAVVLLYVSVQHGTQRDTIKETPTRDVICLDFEYPESKDNNLYQQRENKKICTLIQATFSPKQPFIYSVSIARSPSG